MTIFYLMCFPQVSRRVSAGSPEHKSDSSESSEDDDESHSSSDTASEAPPSPPNMPPPSPDRPKRKPYLISRNRNIFVRRRDITTRDRRKIDTTAYIQTAGQAVLKSQQQETLEEKVTYWVKISQFSDKPNHFKTKYWGTKGRVLKCKFMFLNSACLFK